MAVGAAGVIVSVTWNRMVSSFRQLNAGKFRVIHELEKHLPAALFKAEWAALGEGRDRKLYAPFTKSEGWLARAFGFIYVAAVGLAIWLAVFDS